MERFCAISVLVIFCSFSITLTQPLNGATSDRSYIEDRLATLPGLLEKNQITLNAISENINSLESVLQRTFSEDIELLGDKITYQMAKSLKPLEKLSDLHDLERIADNLGDAGGLVETVDSGLQTISDKLQYRVKIDDTLHTGLDKISDNIDSINSFGLKGLISELSKLKNDLSPVAGNLPDIRGYLPSISSELRGIMENIKEHGVSISNHLMNNKEVDNLRKVHEQQNNERIIDAVEKVVDSIDAGHGKVAVALTAGNEKLNGLIEKGRENLIGSLGELNKSVQASKND